MPAARRRRRGGALDGSCGARCDKRGAWQGEVCDAPARRQHLSRRGSWSARCATQRGAISHYIVHSIDITDRKASEERIRFLAHHDVLTELPNRALCTERLRLAMQQAQRAAAQRWRCCSSTSTASRTSTIRSATTSATRCCARWRSACSDAVRDGDTVSRLGGDEFVVVLNGVGDADEVAAHRRAAPGAAESAQAARPRRRRAARVVQRRHRALSRRRTRHRRR